ncbi:AtzH-like domain-containing protein [Demequina pelophila]|uniref:AtzH-like domain-containing protein n=1 Tax=Demequina pelophila TaxID=1638984 RepID=UPI000781EF0F|nr:AtzH-like domain-containing protein [Demequina pelophila]
MSGPRVHGDAPADLVEAILAYEEALAADDLDALSDFFEPGPATLRADAAGLLVGHDAIDHFRGRRGGAAPRRLAEIHAHRCGEDTWHTTAVVLPAGGGRGVLTQLWRGRGERWTILAAHLTAPAPAMDTRVWRVLGAPLIPGESDGCVAGETVAVKDLFAVAGQRRGVGVRAYLEEASVETETAPAVRALVENGAAVLGIAQTDQFAYSIAGLNPDYGTPPNVAAPGSVPGGSSSGPAAAVALGQASIGLGTDTAGSIRVPASYQGLWGLRTSHGAVSLEGVAPLAPRYDAVGWLTRDGHTLLAAARATLDMQAPVGIGPRVLTAPGCSRALTPQVREAFHATIDALVEAGCPVETVELPPLEELLATFRVTQSAEAWRADGAWVEGHPGTLATDVEARFAWARDVTPERERAGLADLDRHAAAIDEALGDDLLILPSAASAAPPLDADPDVLERLRTATLSLTSIAGLVGRPALSVPVMETPEGPVGLCMVGPRGSDVELIRTGLLIESMLKRRA